MCRRGGGADEPRICDDLEASVKAVYRYSSITPAGHLVPFKRPRPVKIGDLFEPIGQRLRFRVVAINKILNDVPVIVGHTLDGKRQTVARPEDVIPVAGRRSARRR